MPADLDRLYAALGTHADDLPLADPDAVRTRGRQRSRGRHLAAAAATVILLGTATGVGWLMDRSGLPALQDRFISLEPIGPGIPMPLDPANETGSYGMASVVGQPAFGAARTPDGHLRVGAVDLATGGPAWPSRDLGRWGDWMGMIALPQGVIVIGEHDDGTTPDHVAMVVDPASGTLRWQVGIDDLQFEYFDSVLVVLSSADRLIRGLDWQTGAERWRRPIDPGEGTRMLGNHSTGAVPAGRGPYGLATAPRDHRLLVIDPAGTLEVLDARTGDLIATHREVGEPVVGNSRSYYRAYDGMLYGFSSDTRPTRISAFDLDRPARARTLYTVASDDNRITDATPCGPRRLCVISHGSPGADPGTIRADITVIDVAAGRVL